jgi:hypothetical protein
MKGLQIYLKKILHSNRPQRPRLGDVKIYSFFNLGARWCGWSSPRSGRFNPERDRVPILWEAVWVTGVWKISPPPTGIRSTDRPVRSESQYRFTITAHGFKFMVP